MSLHEACRATVSRVGRIDTIRFAAAAALRALTLERIFDPLSRGPDQENKNAGGLGLGLYIASEIAKAHHGSIEARSDQTETVFDVRLPRRA